MLLNIISWNINGKKLLINSNYTQKFLQSYDIILLSETHTIQGDKIKVESFENYDFPDLDCNLEYPRGGTCILTKKHLKNYIQSIYKVKTDCIKIELVNGDQLNSVYIPPSNSPYHNEQIIPILGTMFIEADKDEISMVAIGDINARFGDLNDVTNTFKYNKNPDVGKNDNAKDIVDSIYNTSTCTPINHLIMGEIQFGGGITFIRGKQESQLDWALCNKSALAKLKSFEVVENHPNISDHKPIKLCIKVNMEPSIAKMVKSARELNDRIQNQSDIPTLTDDICNMEAMKRLLPMYLKELMTNTIVNKSPDEITCELQQGIQRCGKITKVRKGKKDSICIDNNERIVEDNNIYPSINQIYTEIAQKDKMEENLKL